MTATEAIHEYIKTHVYKHINEYNERVKKKHSPKQVQELAVSRVMEAWHREEEEDMEWVARQGRDQLAPSVLLH